MKQKSTWEQIAMICRSHAAFVQSVSVHRTVRNARSLGTILAIEIEAGESSYFNSIRKNIYEFFLSRNILLRPLGNVIYVLPPYVISERELQTLYGAIEEFLDRLSNVA